MKHTNYIREAAKFVAGLVAGDLLTGVWMLNAGLLPQTFLGIMITAQTVWLWIGFDVLFLLILIHYAWHPKVMEPEVSSRGLFFVIGVILAAVTLAHFLRLVFGWQLVIGSWSAPFWISWVGLFVAAFISYASFHLALRKRTA